MSDYWMQRSYYDRLEVEPGASLAEITASHRLLSRVWHPDRHPGSLQDVCGQRLAAINEAFEVLSDPLRRERYDATGLLPTTHANGFGGVGDGPFEEAVWNSPQVWKRMAAWMKDEDCGQGFHRKMAYAAGDTLERGRRPSDKQLPYMLQARDTAVADGFDPHEAARA